MDLTIFETYLLSALFLGAFIKFIPLIKEWGDKKFLALQIVITLGGFFVNIILRVYFNENLSEILIGLALFIVFLFFLLMETWLLSKRKANNKNIELVDLISPIINFVVIFSEIFILIYISSESSIL